MLRPNHLSRRRSRYIPTVPWLRHPSKLLSTGTLHTKIYLYGILQATELPDLDISLDSSSSDLHLVVQWVRYSNACDCLLSITRLNVVDRINQVANATMTTIDEDPNSMQMFLLCLLGLYDLSSCFPVMEHVVRGLLLVATRKGIVNSAIARQRYEQIRKGRQSRMFTSSTGTGFVVDLSQAQRVSNSTSVSQLTRDFEGVIINSSE